MRAASDGEPQPTEQPVDVDVIVATHDLRRPVARAVASALWGAESGGRLSSGYRVRVTVACHELDPQEVRTAVEAQADAARHAHDDGALRYLSVRDGLASPSGPFNAGIAAADGRYVSIVGSDDWFADGAVGAWVARADALGSDWLMTRLETEDGQQVPTPRTRPGRTNDLDFVRDGLAYRTAPLGLLRLSRLDQLGLRPGDGTGPLEAGMRTGGDILLSLRLATSGLRIDYSPDLPAYVIATGGGDRITEASRPASVELRAHEHLLAQDWVRTLPAAVRRALAIKMLRIHVLGAVRRRPLVEDWTPEDIATVRDVIGQLLELAPDAAGPLHRADAALLAGLQRAELPQDVAALSLRRAAASRWDILLTPTPTANLDPESTVRAHAANTVGRGLDRLRRGDRPTGSARGRVLVLSLSPIASDARVLKQVRHLSTEFDVVTCGYGPAPAGVVNHVRVPDAVRNRLDGRLITLHAYRAAYWQQAAVRWVRRSLGVGHADVILTNDTETLPLALSLKPRHGVHADLHEYWPRWRAENAAWLERLAPYQEWLCRTYLPRCAAVTTVSPRIAAAYTREFGVPVGVVTNAAPFADLAPTPVRHPRRLVHTGACLRARAIDVMARGVLLAAEQGAPVTLDLYLTPNDPAHLEELRDLAAGSGGVLAVHDPVPYADLTRTLNGYDVGIFVLPPVNANYANALPNKIFDFVQARLGVLVGPSPDMAALVHEHGLGEISADFGAEAIRDAVHQVATGDVAAWKRASHVAAPVLADTEQSRRWVESVGNLVAAGRVGSRG